MSRVKEQRTSIKFCLKLGITAMEILKILIQAFGKNTLGQRVKNSKPLYLESHHIDGTFAFETKLRVTRYRLGKRNPNE